MNEIKITKATENDLDELYPFFENNIRKFFSKEYTPKTLDLFFQRIFSKDKLETALNDGNLLIAKDGDETVGFLMQLKKEEGGTAYADWFAVDESYQGKGIGTQMLKKWEEDCLARGVHTIFLCTEDYNVEFYKNRGFTYMGVMPHGWFGAADHYMYKEIQEPKEENYLK